MTATSSTVLSNVIYLIGAVAVAGVGILVLWWRHRVPTSVDAKMASFQKGLSALAPDRNTSGSTGRSAGQGTEGNFNVRPVAPAVSHLRVRDTSAPVGDERSGPNG